VSDGFTNEPISEEREAYQPDRYGDRWAPILIAFATTDEVPDFGVDIDGEGGSQSVTRPNGQKVYVTGQVYLDARRAAQLESNVRVAAVQALTEHELGHLVGLAHVKDPHQIMWPRASAVLEYQSGDLAGLAELGRGSCAPDV
jgi:hypothetical protein